MLVLGPSESHTNKIRIGVSFHQDVIYDEDIKLDFNFRFSIVMDICKVSVPHKPQSHQSFEQPSSQLGLSLAGNELPAQYLAPFAW